MPQTLEEAQELIEEQKAQIESLTAENTDVKSKNTTILAEKKDLLDKYEALETSTKGTKDENLKTALDKIAALEKTITDGEAARVKDAAVTTQKKLDERIVKAAKGDKAVEEKLKANVALLEKLPRATDSELDVVVNSAFNMLGTKEANPLAAANTTTGGTPTVDSKPSFADTAAGKTFAGKLGFTEVAKADGGDKK